MIDYEKKFDTNNIHSVELNLLDGQVEIILRALELYGYNLEYMLNGSDATDELRQEKIAMLKYTYEQVLATQAEQVDSKANNLDNRSFHILILFCFGLPIFTIFRLRRSFIFRHTRSSLSSNINLSTALR